MLKDVNDTKEDALWLAQKISKLRLFADNNDNMNRSIIEIQGDILVVSQFTLSASTQKGMRPSFTSAAAPALAEELYQYFHTQAALTLPVQTGEFGADMKVSLLNDGPVTIIIDSKNRI